MCGWDVRDYVGGVATGKPREERNGRALVGAPVVRLSDTEAAMEMGKIAVDRSFLSL